jgi:hypothetical protein
MSFGQAIGIVRFANTRDREMRPKRPILFRKSFTRELVF